MTYVDELGAEYLAHITALLARIHAEEQASISKAASLLAEQIASDRLIHIYGPGGHSNLASQEVFFRAGGLMHISAILDEGTMLSGGALRSMAMERTPGYGRIVIENAGLVPGDVLILVNAYGINTALIDAALMANELGVRTIGMSSREHADQTTADHPARHASRSNLHDVVDLHIDTKVPVGDAVVELPGVSEKVGAISTFANAYSLNWLVQCTIRELHERNIEPPVWRSGNAPGGDEANKKFLDRFKGRVHSL
ncbi:sugar isomerase domain-containing protein [Pseudarthrobacter sp. SSS035]|uniref:sugar isomerase domain-containing protein n=1 Tax=Pseudarthrobacter sp. SSS035 TaxID=2931399 RepID=UPI00200C0D2B|nr:SIS domain-containing protein [Pseudarthrobacter sp. SSS035]